MIYGQFLEHFHRQIYGGVFMPGHPLADEAGYRADVLEALRRIRVPVIRWPGGCYVSAHHWENGVGPERIPEFNKAWRVEESNLFGTDEFVEFCRRLNCEPYICTNAGTGSSEEMSNWVEYCNLPSEGIYARKRIAGGHAAPYNVRYWSVGNENYHDGEIGSKTHQEWGRFVRESAKMMKRVDPELQLSAAAIADVDWNVNLLKQAGPWMNLISIHGYWDELWQEDTPASYSQLIARTWNLDRDLKRVRGLLNAFDLENRISIAYDEWNPRGWHHPAVDSAPLGSTGFIEARDRNDLNATYTMADAVFSACFLNMLLRNADIVRMANFAPIVNTRGAIFTHDQGIVLRPTYYVFDLYVNRMGDEVVDCFIENAERMTRTDRYGEAREADLVDAVATRCSADGSLAVALVNKHESETREIRIRAIGPVKSVEFFSLAGDSPDAYNDIGTERVRPERRDEWVTREPGGDLLVRLPAHSVNVLRIIRE